VNVDWTALAISHLQSAYEYIAQDNRQAAEKILQKVFTGIEQLEHFPNIGRSGRVAGTRELLVAGTPFVVPYRVQRGRIEVLAVFHASRKWPEKL
jgi:toxin ParE1/3/4